MLVVNGSGGPKLLARESTPRAIGDAGRIGALRAVAEVAGEAVCATGGIVGVSNRVT